MLKLVVLVLLLAMVVSLFSGLFFLYRDRGSGTRTVRALTLRVMLALTIFIILMVSLRLGLIPA